MTVPGLTIVSVSPSTSTLCPSSRSASVVHPTLLLSPRYAELTSATSGGTSAVVAGRVIIGRSDIGQRQWARSAAIDVGKTVLHRKASGHQHGPGKPHDLGISGER